MDADTITMELHSGILYEHTAQGFAISVPSVLTNSVTVQWNGSRIIFAYVSQCNDSEVNHIKSDRL